MPFVSIKVAGPELTPAQTEALQRGATRLMVEAMRKKGDLTAVLVEQAPVKGWAIGEGVPMLAAHLDVKVTAGTNTAEEKERFIAGAMALLRDTLGQSLHPTTYVVVHEVPATDWGYSGETQANRAARRHTEHAA